MSYDFDGRTSFSVEGSRWRRLNPDGSYPAVDNQLGFEGTVDLTDLAATDVVSYRLNGTGDFTDIIVDLTGAGVAVDDTAASVAELVTALNLDSNFSAVFTASVDSSTGRLKVIETADTATYLELTGVIIVTLMFGSYTGATTGFGTQWVDCFDDQGAVGLPKEIKDFEEIEVEIGDGTTLTMVTAALLKGLNPTLALADEKFELKELVMGGSNSQTVTGVNNRYTPPTESQIYLPGFAGEVFESRYGKGSSQKSQMIGYKRLNLNNCTGMEGDLSAEVKSWATYAFNLRVRSTVSGGVTVPGYTEDDLTIAQFNSLGISFG